jgi:hypothetical protein
VTAAQRLRLVLTLGVINLVLAGVVLAVGVVDFQSPPTTAGGATPGIAFVSPAPTIVPEPTAPSSGEPGTSTPGSPAPTSGPNAEPTPEIPAGSPAIEPSPSAEPSPSIEPPLDQPIALVPNPVRAPAGVVAQPTLRSPTPTPSPTEATPDSPGTPDTDQPGRAHEPKPLKDQHHQEPHGHHGHHGHHGLGDEQATVDKSQRGHKFGRRLRIRRLAR